MDLTSAYSAVDEILETVDFIPRDPIPYTESLLQQTDHGTKFYASVQRHSRQFLDPPTHVVRWRNSQIEQLQRQIIELAFTRTGEKKTNKYSRPTSSALFTWSSDEAYIQARRQEMVRLGKALGTDNGGTDRQDGRNDGRAAETLVDRVKLKVVDKQVLSKLNQVIESESNRLVHERIQLIKAHHSEQISQKINERKRRDHEIHLQRLRLKEEQYERELRAATEDREREKGNKFLGLFTFGNTDNSSVTSEKEQKRFSFLPKTSIFGAEKPKSEEPEKESELVKENSKDAETETGEDDIEKNRNPSAEDRDDTVKVSSPKHTHTPTTPPQTSPVFMANDLDKVFQMPAVSEFDEFDDFKLTLPDPQTPQREPVITSHRFLPISEPTPLIDIESPKEDKKSDKTLSELLSL